MGQGVQPAIGAGQPGYRSGCGGIDLFSGGFSFINSDQLVGLLKNVMNNAKGYAFTLALEAATPQLANVIKYLQEQAAKINAMNTLPLLHASSAAATVHSSQRAAHKSKHSAHDNNIGLNVYSHKCNDCY